MAFECFGHAQSKLKNAKSEVNNLNNQKVWLVSWKQYGVSSIERVNLVAAASFKV